MFFGVLMLFSANPFSTAVAGAPSEGEGLNPLLQNYWMMIHPPMLYLGMTGWAVPFAFCVAALVTGRLDDVLERRRSRLTGEVEIHGALLRALDEPDDGLGRVLG